MQDKPRRAFLAIICFAALGQGVANSVAAQPGDVQLPPGASSSMSLGDLDRRLDELGRQFDGDIGIAVQDVQTGEIAEFDGHTYFPQQSVSKFWVALTALDAHDRKTKDLGSSLILTYADLTLFHQPIAAEIRAAGRYQTTIEALLTRALQQSDNTCNDAVLRSIGGSAAVHAFLASKKIDGIRFGPGERPMQSRIAGLTWRQDYSRGNAFYEARNKVSLATRQSAFDDYVANPIDGAQPVAVVNALARLRRGELLSPESTARLLDIMSHTRTGPQRLKGGLSEGWTLAHKTGTGQQLGAYQTGYNDIGLLTSPTGRSYSVAVMIRRTSAPIWSRMQVMQNVVRAVISYDSAARPLVPDGYVTTLRRR